VELNASEEENEKVARDVKKFQDLIALCTTKEAKLVDELSRKDEVLTTKTTEISELEATKEVLEKPDFTRSVKQITDLSESSNLSPQHLQP